MSVYGTYRPTIGDGRLKARFVGKFMRVHRDDMAAMIEALPHVGE